MARLRFILLDFFCSECYKKVKANILNCYLTKKGNVRVNVECVDCKQKYSLTRRIGFLKKFKLSKVKRR